MLGKKVGFGVDPSFNMGINFMTVRIRNASANGTQATTKAASKASKTGKTPAVAPDQAEDDASRQAVPAVSSSDEEVPAHAGQGDEAGAAEAPAEEAPAAEETPAEEQAAEQPAAEAGDDTQADG